MSARIQKYRNRAQTRLDKAPLRQFTARFATAEEIENWDKHVTANPNGGNMLQSAAYASVKNGSGWKVRFLVLESDGSASYNLVLERSFPVLGRLWYLIKGPDLAAAADLGSALEACASFVRSRKLNVFTIKVEPDIIDSDEAQKELRAANLVKAPNIQSNDSTALLDISGSEEEVFKAISSRARNAIRRAEREGCQVIRKEQGPETYRALYDLMANTVNAKGSMPLRSYDYYARFWDEFCNRGQGNFFFTYEDGKPSVGAFVINYGAKATYKDGGSTQNRKQYGDSHLVQWAAIRRMQELGCTEYDFCGTPPAARIKDKTHNLFGMGMFKTSFTKTVTDFVGCHDYVLSPLRHRFWVNGGEKVFRRIETARTGQQFY
ncbi:peptidoglycan bridge formation glycyltransferase FemA/FemB family protein [Pseudarthrobacter sp. BRE9]|jgi:serine/alanine adding enzyme|uniref:lipid II:glycine glycyltransferase FemX n=1 Tax=Pseudarthrobacter sp. BRE9 TaxID=2962582 RepID=UPI0028819545|nr:peptidoglycan bridge formation glycyltransferase FemA/FemB family protein [Pseudarthrobacter sp. BRE9]MDT0170612.1 peptidoglycan bridge formation glycyltransferase FemA/FemB family protein [Pseudarthrobacter sp. BRE9]